MRDEVTLRRLRHGQHDGCIVAPAAADTHASTRIGLQPELPLAAIDPSSATARLVDRVDQAGNIVGTLIVRASRPDRARGDLGLA
jgi:hypothetical protein